MTNPEPQLSDADAGLIRDARRAVLTTIDARDGRPRSVPICFAMLGVTLYSPLDEKPKAAADVRGLRRVRNLAADPRATILIDRWDEDWPQLAFVELDCRGSLVEPGEPDHREVVVALRAKYPQYLSQRLEDRPLLRFAVVGVVSWRGEPRNRPRPPAPAISATQPRPPRPRS